jgi:predicted RecB family nuclease
MQFKDAALRASPTDLANFLSCRHKTALDLLVACGRLAKPSWKDPFADVLRQRGAMHEHAYVEALRARGLRVVDLSEADEGTRVTKTVRAMREGADVIVQAALESGQWLGYADVLRRVEQSSTLGAWSYEVHDTKLARETRGGTILQLCVYSDLVGVIQGRPPEHFHVVTPVNVETYRVDDYAAFYRLVRDRFLSSLDVFAEPPADDAAAPDVVDHCEVCRWWQRCQDTRRRQDHLSFVAGLGRVQQVELVSQEIRTLAALAATPVPLPFVPSRGVPETYERLQDQAALQLRQRESGQPVHRLLPVEPERGLMLLPEPSPGDLFLDLEGDPFAREGGREYLFGLGSIALDGTFSYTGRWAFTDVDERAAFDAVIDEISSALRAHPGMHVYHYAPYEPAAMKRLMGRYASREQEVDALLRGDRFVDLYAIVRQAVRAGVESYSIKALEPFYGFRRDIELARAGHERRLIEIALELNDFGAVTADVRRAVEGYNKDDCRSTLALRDWLESLRTTHIAGGTAIPRPTFELGEAPETVKARQLEIEALRTRLLDGLPADRHAHTPEQRARYLLAYLLDWQYREDKVAWWNYFRLLDLSEDDLFDEPGAVSGLEFVEAIEVVRNKATGKPTGSVVERYRYPPQEMDLRRGDDLRLSDESPFGKVEQVDRLARTIDVKKGPKAASVYPTAAFRHERVPQDTPAQSIRRLTARILECGFDLSGPGRAGCDLLLGRSPRIGQIGSLVDLSPRSGESIPDLARRVVLDLDETTLPIQGPPGSGKTFTGARMICALVAAGRRVGVTATSHKVIRNLLDAVNREAAALGQRVRCGRKVTEVDEDQTPEICEFDDNRDALAALTTGMIDVLGGTAWLWSLEDAEAAVDVLFVDEAGQMSLANVLAVSPAARNLVLLGDPQQLEQPQKGSHPDGVDVSALDHVLGGHQTMPPERGLFLPVTWRLAPAISVFTSELFYESKLDSRDGLECQRLIGTGRFDGAGLFVVDVAHDGCRNASDEEVDVVHGIVQELLTSGVECVELDLVTGAPRAARRLTADDILIVAPYNAQVSRLQERLGGAMRVGTVDKFQGQEAPVVIYSMTTSRPEDAPHGLEFLFSLNRLNVATSRAKCTAIVVASPRLFEPDCRTPRHMQLANALCRYREMANVVPTSP